MRRLGPASAVAAAADPVIMAAGDISCEGPAKATPEPCGSIYTSGLALEQARAADGLAAVLVLGDEQYESGTLGSFTTYFDQSWGRLGKLMRPVPGNHEYDTAGASGYFDYFASKGIETGARDAGYYSFDIGSWHFVALNSNDQCTLVACTAGSAQETWLAQDLAATDQPCIAAFMHHPQKTAGAGALWADLYAAGADFMFVGHDHGYVSPVALDASNGPDPNGVRQVVVGTGGKSGTQYGLLKLTLHPTSADWNFVGNITDTGSAACHRAPDQPPPAAKPTAAFTTTTAGLTATFTGTAAPAATSWAWNFGDGKLGAGATTSHTYAASGTYTVTLVASNAGGPSAPVTKAVTVQVPGAPSPPPAVVVGGGGTPSPPVSAPSGASAQDGGGRPIAEIAPAPSPGSIAAPSGPQFQASSAAVPLGMRLSRTRASFASLLRGFPLLVSGPARTQLTVTMVVPASVAKRAHLGRRTLAARTLSTPGPATLRVPKRLVSALRRTHRSVTVTISVRSPRLRTVTRTLTLRR